MQLTQFQKLALLLLGSLGWVGCSYRTEKIPAEAATIVSAEMLAKVSYQMVKTEVFDRSCVSCHDGQGPNLNLSNYASALSVLARIKTSTLDDRKMPKAPEAPLTLRQREVLTAWIQVGGRLLPADGSDTPPPPPPVLEPTFSSIHRLILQPKCISCHRVGSSSQANEMPFTTYDEIRNHPRYVVNPDNPDEGESLLTAVLRSGAAKAMPPADSGISPVSAEELLIIEEWIRRGANND